MNAPVAFSRSPCIGVMMVCFVLVSASRDNLNAIARDCAPAATTPTNSNVTANGPCHEYKDGNEFMFRIVFKDQGDYNNFKSGWKAHICYSKNGKQKEWEFSRSQPVNQANVMAYYVWVNAHDPGGQSTHGPGKGKVIVTSDDRSGDGSNQTAKHQEKEQYIVGDYTGPGADQTGLPIEKQW